MLGRIVPEEPVKKEPVEWPDFEARAREIFGNHVLPAVESLLEDRENSRY